MPEAWRRRMEMAAVKSQSLCLMVKILWYLTSLLLVLPVAAGLTLTGQNGSSITLPCNSSHTEDLSVLLTFGTIAAYGRDQDKHFKGRVDKIGRCGFILQDLTSTDAGNYVSKVYSNGLEINSYTYDIHVIVNVTGQKGEEVTFGLPHEAESIERFTNTGWREVWRRERGDPIDRLTYRSGRLTIDNITSNDSTTYRVLNPSGQILIALNVTECKPMERSGLEVSSGSNTTRVSWSAALPFLPFLFSGFL